MMKKLISLILAAALCCTAAFSLAGCGGDGNYPVSIANITIAKEPTSIVVLDPSSADIISYMSFDGKIVGRSDEVDQSYLSVAPTMGAANTPSTQAIINTKAEIVFATDKLDESVANELRDANIHKLKIDATALNTNNTIDTACYMYVDNGTLRVMNNGTYVDMLIGYTGAVNVAVNADQGDVDINTLKLANPNYIFYADKQTYDVFVNDNILSQLTAVQTSRTFLLPEKDVTRQGLTALKTLEKMIGYMHPELAKTTEPAAQPSEPAANEAATPAANEAAPAATEAATQAAQPKSEAEKYDIAINDELSLKKDDNNANVKAMQQRLFDLGYITDSENVTGYYGDVSVKAVETFQKNSKLEETGTADNKTLVALFLDNAPKAE